MSARESVGESNSIVPHGYLDWEDWLVRERSAETKMDFFPLPLDWVFPCFLETLAEGCLDAALLFMLDLLDELSSPPSTLRALEEAPLVTRG